MNVLINQICCGCCPTKYLTQASHRYSQLQRKTIIISLSKKVWIKSAFTGNADPLTHNEKSNYHLDRSKSSNSVNVQCPSFSLNNMPTLEEPNDMVRLRKTSHQQNNNVQHRPPLTG
mmetsp:Transcript_19960/g.30213  ORF Transcript_19960/g.30213 Transcript_19960/m.30213 type:complete len:117 (-) Transcript_19960:753-1103(-)